MGLGLEIGFDGLTVLSEVPTYLPTCDERMLIRLTPRYAYCSYQHLNIL